MAAGRTLTLGLKFIGAKAVRDAVAGINKELKASEQNVVRLRTAALPRNVRERTRIDLQQDEAKRHLSFAQTQERARQLGPTKAIADFLGFGPSGKVGSFLTKAGGTLSGIGKSVGGAAGGMLGKAGSALGGAAGGPVGLAIGAALALAPVVKSLAAAPFQAVAGGMASVNKWLAGLNGKLGPIGSILGGTSDALDGFASKMKFINPVMAGVAESVSAVLKQFQAFLGIAVDLVAKARPGEIKRLQLALDDTAAVVGHRLVPVVELMRGVIRGIGDVLQTVLPSTQEFRAALAPIGEAWNDVKQALVPVAIIKANFIVGLKLLGAALKGAALGLKILLQPLMTLAQVAGVKMESSVGAAARQATLTTPEEYAKQVYQAAASSGMDPTKQTAENTGRMVDLLDRIRGLLETEGPGEAASPLSAAAAAAAAAWTGVGG